MFFGLRKMPEIFPEEMKNGGILWFSDLSVHDPYYIMPVMASTSFLLSIEANKEAMVAASAAQGELMLNVFRLMGIVMIPSISFFSAGLNCYWVTNNTITLLQTLLFKSPNVRTYLGIWDPPKPVPGGPVAKGILETAQEGLERIIEGKKKTTPKEQIEQHNKAIDEKKYLTMIGTNSRDRRRKITRRAGRTLPPTS
jgi:membrane protein insertase Oxa1/YidC/SpoIIIJ